MPEQSSPGPAHSRTGSGVRKRGSARVSNACERCRRQKIKCSGKEPCDACQKRRLVCNFDELNQKVLVTREQLAQLQREARHGSNTGPQTPPTTSCRSNDTHTINARSLITGSVGNLTGNVLPPFDIDNNSSTEHDAITSEAYHNPAGDDGDATPDDPARLGLDIAAETEHDSCNRSAAGEQHFTNPLVNGPPVFTADEFGEQSYLGTSSNWSFGRRVLVMVHETLFGLAPPPGRLLFEGQAYELDCQSASTAEQGVRDPSVVLPTSDFALFLINTVKFRCGQLFHLFDEESFMQSFSKFHSNEHPREPVGTLWYSHYLLVLALGKALVVIFTSGTKPAGSELFIEAMRMLPDIGLSAADPIQSMEILCCAALYLQCLDKRKAAYNQIGRALRTALVEGMHTNMSNRNLADSMRERCREIWWTIYILDSHMAALMGVPQSLSEHDMTAQLPEFATHTSKSLALGIHVKLARATSSILQTIYGREGREPSKFLYSIKDALSNLASIHDDRVASFRIHLGKSSISRLSAYLLLFQHQCIILATRPLLFHFWQRRLASPRPIHVPSSGGARSLVRICLGAAQQIMRTLEVLQSQSLLESLVPFDLESTWSASVVLLVAHAVDPSLLRNVAELRVISYAVLSEMVARGNRVATFYKEELELLEHHLRELASGAVNLESSAVDYGAAGGPGPGPGPGSNSNSESTGQFDTTGFAAAGGPALQEWYFDDGMIDGEQLMRAAESLDVDAFQWYTDDTFEGLDASLL